MACVTAPLSELLNLHIARMTTIEGKESERVRQRTL